MVWSLNRCVYTKGVHSNMLSWIMFDSSPPRTVTLVLPLAEQFIIVLAFILYVQISKDLFFADIARDILTYIARDLSDIVSGVSCAVFN